MRVGGSLALPYPPEMPKGKSSSSKSGGDPLKTYRGKRDFEKSPEPAGKPAPKRKEKAGGPMFCVQQHLARRLHYDFRLEHEGVLLSWAVPKGPSLNPADKRQAVRTEDHPLDYGNFEGVIPDGYGAGVVLLWDKGTWTCDNPPVEEALKQGEIKCTLAGVKLKGSWVLVRMKPSEGERQESWLMIKHRDAWAGEVDVLEIAPQSVKSWGGLEDVLAAAGVPDGWRKSPPVKSGETAARFRAVIEGATRKAAAKTLSGSKRKGAKPTISAELPPGALSLVGKKPKFTNLDKPLYPGGFTKGQVIDYYTRIAPCMLPHLRGRATTLKRYPDGVEGEVFFEKNCPKHRPDWVETAEIEHSSGKRINYCVIKDLPTLLWTANLAALELHVPLALAADPATATSMVFDLDPGAPADLGDCARVGLRLREMLKVLGLQSFAKLSGGKGVHMYVPLNTPGINFDHTKHFSRAIATLMQREDATRITASMAKSLRGGKVFIDWSQNDQQKTTACVYTMRGTEEPRVSMPVTWEELARPKSLPVPTPQAAIKRCQQMGDLFRPLLELQQSLPATVPG